MFSYKFLLAMFRTIIILTVILFSANITAAYEVSNKKIFYEKYMPDGRVVRVMKSSSVKMSPKPEKDYMQIGDLKLKVVRGENQTDKYSMIIKDGNSEIITAWEKVVITPKFTLTQPGRNKVCNFTIHDIQMKGDRTAVLFSDGTYENLLMLETVGHGPDGVRRVLSSKCLDPNGQLSLNIISTVAKGYLVWLDNCLYIIAEIVSGADLLWELKSDKSEKDIFSQVSGPFSLHGFIREKGQSGSRAE